MVAPLEAAGAFLSRRVSIAWVPDAASEPTDTLVLTGSKYYVDLRILKGEEGVLDWGMAGVKEFVGGSSDAPKARFTNIIDSHLPPPFTPAPPSEGVEPALPDEGIFTSLPSGETKETGTMVNPATGKTQEYEEIWASEEVARGSRVLILRSVSGSGGEGTIFLGVIGPWAMGIGVFEETGGKEQARFGGWKARRGSAAWEVEWRSKDLDRVVGLPGGEAWEGLVSDWREGDTVDWESRRWTVLEHSLMGAGRG